MQPGQFLIHEGGSKAKILGICGEVIFLSLEDKFDKASSEIYTEEDLKECGWSLLEEPWIPDYNEDYWYVSSDGNILFQRRAIEDGSATEFRISVGNAHKTSKAAELYKQKLIERMGRKEN